MISTDSFKDYCLLDAGDGEKLESYNGIIIRRPDPVAIWPKFKPELWKKAQAFYHRSNSGGGYWEKLNKIDDKWNIKYKDLTFKVSLTNFKHTGIFPEQAANWDYILEKLDNHHSANILNLFAYTGIATTVAASKNINEVVHVDAAKGMIDWAKENRDLSSLNNAKIRYIVDDCLKFMKREVRRGRKYDGIIMDPPSYGRGPNNEVFKFEEQINPLIDEAINLLSDNPLFIIINSYTTGYSPTVMKNIMSNKIKSRNLKGHIESDEIGIQIKDSDYYLPCGVTTRWSND